MYMHIYLTIPFYFIALKVTISNNTPNNTSSDIEGITINDIDDIIIKNNNQNSSTTYY